MSLWHHSLQLVPTKSEAQRTCWAVCCLPLPRKWACANFHTNSKIIKSINFTCTPEPSLWRMSRRHKTEEATTTKSREIRRRMQKSEEGLSIGTKCLNSHVWDNTVVNARTDQESITSTEEERQLNTNYCSLLRLRTIYTKLVRTLCRQLIIQMPHHYHNLRKRITLGPPNQSNQANDPIIIIITRKMPKPMQSQQKRNRKAILQIPN